MKILFIIFLSLANAEICFGQSSILQKYQVSYTYSTKVAIDGLGLADVPFLIQFNVIGNKDSSEVLSFVEPVNPADNIKLVMNTQSKLIFNGKNWFSIDDGVTKLSPFGIDSTKKTDEEKVILGYKVRKYIGKTIVEGYEAVIWVCKDLPETLMPGGGVPPIGGAVLELSLPHYQSHWVATSVKKVFDVGLHIK